MTKLPSFQSVLLGKLRLIRSQYNHRAGEKMGITQRRFLDWFKVWPEASALGLIDQHYAICWELHQQGQARERAKYQRKQVKQAVEGKPSTFEPTPRKIFALNNDGSYTEIYNDYPA